MMKFDDSEIRRKVLAELDWDPGIDASAVGVTVKDAVVTLNGFVPNYWQKSECERAVKRVSGVTALAEDLRIKLAGCAERTDTDIAHSAATTLRFNIVVPPQSVRVTVEGGWVTLEGEVEWQYQKSAAENSIRYLTGVKGVTNNINIRPTVRAPDVKLKIESAFARRAHLEAKQIKVATADSKVTLRGTVQTWSEKEQAEQAAWSAPGVTKVENDLVVCP